ncbi:MAG: hypothetical protein ACREJL_03260 [Candidatus Methylomirabilales bacterium]
MEKALCLRPFGALLEPFLPGGGACATPEALSTRQRRSGPTNPPRSLSPDLRHLGLSVWDHRHQRRLVRDRSAQHIWAADQEIDHDHTAAAVDASVLDRISVQTIRQALRYRIFKVALSWPRERDVMD